MIFVVFNEFESPLPFDVLSVATFSQEMACRFESAVSKAEKVDDLASRAPG